MTNEPNWVSLSWRLLEKGEIVKATDWVDATNDGWRNDPVWKPASRPGEPAPDPMYPAHRRFRRVISTDQSHEPTSRRND